MSQNGEVSTFQFINSVDSLLPRDNSVRKTIRKQAMSRAAAARRQKGNYGKKNLRQHPTFLETAGQAEGAASQNQSLPTLTLHHIHPHLPDGLAGDATGKARHIVQTQKASIKHRSLNLGLVLTPTVPASLPSTGYESLRIQYDFNILDLSALTSFHAGRATAHALLRDPLRLVDILQCRQWSYFSFLPSRFGHIACLDDATRCVAAKVRHRLSSPSNSPCTVVLSLYSKALASLQNALEDPDRCLQPDVLCATEMLAIYELLDSGGVQAWTRHVGGATSLVKLRGPERYQTDFEKSLFLAQIGPMFTEALLEGRSCFLEEESWQAVFRSLILDTSPFSGRSSIAVSLWMSICHIPRLFTEVEDTILSSRDLGFPAVEQLTSRIYQLRNLLVDWRKRFEALLNKHSDSSYKQAKIDKRYETLGVALGMLIVLDRLIVALSRDVARKFEDQAQSLAKQIMDLEQQARVANPRAGIFMAFKIIVAKATLTTKDEWQEWTNTSHESGTKSSNIIPKELFQHWCSLKGRKTTSRIPVIWQKA